LTRCRPPQPGGEQTSAEATQEREITQNAHRSPQFVRRCKTQRLATGIRATMEKSA
jgi:hypothetical protein